MSVYPRLLVKFLLSPSRHLLAQSEQWKHQNNVRNLSKVNNKNYRTASMKSFWCIFYLLLSFCRFYKLFLYFSCCLWTSNCPLGSRENPIKRENSIKISFPFTTYVVLFNWIKELLRNTEPYSKPCQTSKMKLFLKI